MISLLILLFLREVTGATFFHQYESEHQIQIFNESAGESNTAWWFGQDNSLQRFEQSCCSKDGDLHDDFGCEECHNKFHLDNFQNGGMFACKTLTGLSTPKKETPVFTSEEDCEEFNFFIVAIINSTAEQSSKNTGVQSEEKVSNEEKENFNLSCKFELGAKTSEFVVYWFKETEPTTCLFSVTNEGQHSLDNFDNDINCCIDPAFKERRINFSTTLDSEHRHQSHTVTITHSTASDSGIYFCVVAAYNKKYRWTIESRISVTIRQSSPLSSKIKLKISLAVTAAMCLVVGIILFLCWKKNAKGKPLECQQRDQTTVAPEDCSPYAVSSHKDLDGSITVYSLATSPGEAPFAACSLPEGSPSPGVRHGDDVQALYARVLKD
ncbi:uncharacterized protein LOC103062734 [Python bivittatus]|uniref:Uncharacterized protein LOC103062734 n=1 Tax=Python bivittatus TaxID=176946 RepID=A0A9F5IZF8_PYTBI|nr:uncharacterized protein LOC103062734 [Python bivittatus]XP_025029687.1 uncharacterized protein LOC103062734 [Python bivittatus]